MAKRPSFQFYPGDWLRDTALRTCSVAARGLWIEMICLMHEGQPYGHLKVGEKVIDARTLARMVGSNPRTIRSLLDQLLHANVCEKSSDGTIISRRMIRDEEIRTKRAEGGRKGGNPSLMKPSKVASEVHPKVNLPPNLGLTPSSSSASSSATTPPPHPPEGGTPSALEGLELFDNDADLLGRWPELWARWKKVFPKVNLERQILLAHEQQMAAPPSKRRKSRARFLSNWFKNSETFEKRDAERDGRAGGGDDFYEWMGSKKKSDRRK